MLILARKIGSYIQIGNDIKIYINDVRGSVVKVGIDAPKDMVILREELIDEKSVDSQGNIQRIYRNF